MKPAYPIAPEVKTLVECARNQVATRLNVLFREAQMIEALGQERAIQLERLTASGGDALEWVSEYVRQAIRGRMSCLGPVGLWHVVNAINLVRNCTDERWVYMCDADRRRNLQRASDELDALAQCVADAKGSTLQAADRLTA